MTVSWGFSRTWRSVKLYWDLSQMFKTWVFKRKMCLFAFDKICCPKFKLQEANHLSKRGSQLAQGTGLLLKQTLWYKGQWSYSYWYKNTSERRIQWMLNPKRPCLRSIIIIQSVEVLRFEHRDSVVHQVGERGIRTIILECGEVEGIGEWAINWKMVCIFML